MVATRYLRLKGIVFKTSSSASLYFLKHVSLDLLANLPVLSHPVNAWNPIISPERLGPRYLYSCITAEVADFPRKCVSL